MADSTVQPSLASANDSHRALPTNGYPVSEQKQNGEGADLFMELARQFDALDELMGESIEGSTPARIHEMDQLEAALFATASLSPESLVWRINLVRRAIENNWTVAAAAQLLESLDRDVREAGRLAMEAQSQA